MNAFDLPDRTKRFALNVIYLSKYLPRDDEFRIIKNQVLRSATSVAANYRAVAKAQTKKIFVAKLNIVIEEADETMFWLEILDDLILNSAIKSKLKKLIDEANQLVSIFIASRKTATKTN